MIIITTIQFSFSFHFFSSKPGSPPGLLILRREHLNEKASPLIDGPKVGSIVSATEYLNILACILLPQAYKLAVGSFEKQSRHYTHSQQQPTG